MPCIELNRITQANRGASYGYPYCWSEDKWPKNEGGLGTGTQWSWYTFANGTFNDIWCRNVTNNIPPLITYPSHESSLGNQLVTLLYTWR
jgi:hypothetical protein